MNLLLFIIYVSKCVCTTCFLFGFILDVQEKNLFSDKSGLYCHKTFGKIFVYHSKVIVLLLPKSIFAKRSFSDKTYDNTQIFCCLVSGCYKNCGIERKQTLFMSKWWCDILNILVEIIHGESHGTKISRVCSIFFAEEGFSTTILEKRTWNSCKKLTAQQERDWKLTSTTPTRFYLIKQNKRKMIPFFAPV